MTGGALLILLFCAGACYAQDKNVVELAVATPSLSKLVEAVKAADLAGTLSDAGPFTVFAPTDDALAAYKRTKTAAYLHQGSPHGLTASGPQDGNAGILVQHHEQTKHLEKSRGRK